MQHYYKDAYPTPEEVMKNRLIDGCLVCIRERGINKTSVGDIARETGVARQTVYRHFTNKTAILSEAFYREGYSFALEVAGAIRHVESLEDKFIAAFIYVVEHFSSNPILYQIVAPGSTFLSDVGLQHYPFSDFGKLVFSDIFERFESLDQQSEEISELWTRNALSFIAMPGRAERTPEQLHDFVRRRLVPGLGLASMPLSVPQSITRTRLDLSALNLGGPK